MIGAIPIVERGEYAVSTMLDRPGMHRARLRNEHALSHAHLRKFDADNPGFLDHPIVREVGHHLVTNAQREDLERSGLYDAFRKQAGRDPTDSELQDLHLHARAHGHPVRPAHQLIHDVASDIERRVPSLRRRQRHGATTGESST
jgi:hypothetical protein